MRLILVVWTRCKLIYKKWIHIETISKWFRNIHEKKERKTFFPRLFKIYLVLPICIECKMQSRDFRSFYPTRGWVQKIIALSVSTLSHFQFVIEFFWYAKSHELFHHKTFRCGISREKLSRVFRNLISAKVSLLQLRVLFWILALSNSWTVHRKFSHFWRNWMERRERVCNWWFYSNPTTFTKSFHRESTKLFSLHIPKPLPNPTAWKILRSYLEESAIRKFPNKLCLGFFSLWRSRPRVEAGRSITTQPGGA